MDQRFAQEYLPRLNFVLTIEIDDNKENAEKIFFNRTIDNNKYVPLLKKEDLSDNKCFRTIKFIHNKEDFNKTVNIHKISLILSTYSKGKLIPLSYEDILIQARSENCLQKFQFFQNMNTRHSSRKIANILFSFVYSKENKYINKELCNNYSHLFNQIEITSSFNQEIESEFLYWNIPNNSLTTDQKENPIKESLFSINDIQDVEVSAELRYGKVSLDRLLVLLSIVKKKYELYEVIEHLNSNLFTKEFEEEKVILYKEKIILRLGFLVKYEESIDDKVLIPFIFSTLEMLFFKMKKNPMNMMRSNFRKFRHLTKIKRLEENETFAINLNEEEENSIVSDGSLIQEKIHTPDIDLIKQSFKLSLEIINFHKEICTEILLSILNYMNKVIEENTQIEINDLIDLNKDFVLWGILQTHISNEGVVLPITSIFAKILKQQTIQFTFNNNCKEVLQEIISSHISNSQIITNILFITYYLLEVIPLEGILFFLPFSKIKEIFVTFTLNSFDFIHETVLHLIKGILTQQTRSIHLTDEDFSEMTTIFAFALALLKNKVTQIDLKTLSKWTFNLLTVVFTIINILNNCGSESTTKIKISKICKDKKITELVIEIFYALYEKNFFMNNSKLSLKLDVNSLNSKGMLFRTLFHCVNLVKVNNLSGSILNKNSAEKMYKTIKNIEDNDAAFHPIEILKQIKKGYNKTDNEELYKNLLTSQKSLREYYCRYKTVLPDFIKELIKCIKS